MQSIQPHFAQVVFFQGIFSSWYQVQRVADILFPNGSFVTHRQDLPEVLYFKHSEWTWNPMHWFMKIFTYLFRTGPPYSINLADMNIAQTADVAELIQRDKDIPLDQLISFGMSRGAATTFVRHALYPERKAKLVLLEGCPDSIPNVMEYRYGVQGATVVEWLLTRLTSYDASFARTHSPLALAAHFPKDVPIAFVTSERDTKVQPAGTLRLVAALHAAGHKMIHVLVLKDADHDCSLTWSERDKTAYVDFVKDLHKRYGIRHFHRWFEEEGEVLGAKDDDVKQE